MPLVATSVTLVVLQQVMLAEPQLIQAWLTTVVVCLPTPVVVVAEVQPPQLCETTVMAGTR